MLVPVNIDESKTLTLAHSFGCIVGKLPFAYPGLPLGLTNPKVLDFLPLVTRCERRLISTSTFLTHAGKLQMTNAGKLQMTNAVFTSLPMFLCTFKMHQRVVGQVDIYGKHCLWRGGDVNAKKSVQIKQPGRWYVSQNLKGALAY